VLLKQTSINQEKQEDLVQSYTDFYKEGDQLMMQTIKKSGRRL